MDTYKVIFVKHPQLFRKLRVNRLEMFILAKSIKHAARISAAKLKKQQIKDFELLGVFKTNENETL